MKTSDAKTGLLAAALLLSSPLVSAESQYPAADFEPVIITRNADLISKHDQAAKDREAAEQAKVAKRSQAAAASAASQSSSAAAEVDASQTGDASVSAKQESSMDNFPVALVVFALAGFVFWSTKRPASKAQEVRYDSASVAPAASVGGETGVAKYLKEVEASARKAAGTGVTRYLKTLEASAAPKAPETGVSKYIKSTDLSSKKAAPKTGVEKYLDNRGR